MKSTLAKRCFPQYIVVVRYSKNVYLILDVLKESKRSLTAVCILAGGYILIAALVIFNLEPDI